MPGREVVIIGSVDANREFDPPVHHPELARAACEQLGAELAAADWDIVVFSDDPGFIEHSVVRGYLAGAEKGRRRRGRVIMRAPRRKLHRAFTEEGIGARIEYQPDTNDEWEVSFYRSLFSADGVLLVGGGRSTHIAGILALTRGIPTVPLAAFGGSAGLVWSKMKSLREDTTDEDIAVLGSPWGPGSARQAVAVLDRQHERRGTSPGPAVAEERRRRRAHVLGSVTAIAALLLAVATLPLSSAWRSPMAALSLLMSGPVLGAVGGALLRDRVSNPLDHLWAVARGLGAGLLSALLYVASQLLTTPDLFDRLDATRLLWFVIPLGIAAGLTSETVYAKVRKAQIVDVTALGAAPPPTAGA
ncbi:hypothetical protein FHX81_6909 [Saccharothrix saharensis]|uniref:Uncharacterized protein n=1 Tax=Saccharothrix saharensis TaxID=571190 RepID=A0A543JNQ6_9PSEU|nr:hypothetical protein [Saccharothrix saharensis]TQM84463.1 hypothetical protein FHX81_6909 [Saccharothrix saharensis]